MGMVLGPVCPVLDIRLRFRVIAVGLLAKAFVLLALGPRSHGHDLGQKGEEVRTQPSMQGASSWGWRSEEGPG